MDAAKNIVILYQQMRIFFLFLNFKNYLTIVYNDVTFNNMQCILHVILFKDTLLYY